MRQHAKSFSLFQLIDRKDFDVLALKWGMDKGVRNFSTWEMTQALITCLVYRLNSYREVEAALGIADSTFGDALCSRPAGFFQELCELILRKTLEQSQNRKLKQLIRQVLAIDSTECHVHGSLFSHAGWKQKHSLGHKASCKLHVVWNVNEQWIDDFRVSGSRNGDLSTARDFELKTDKIYVFDRAYMDLRFWFDIQQANSDFVTRLKKSPRRDARHRAVLDDSESGKKKIGVLWDGKWSPSEAASYRQGFHPRDLRKKFRHIIYRDPVSGKLFDFVSSIQDLPAQAIADIYRLRWRVELLFRWLKGHLEIRRFATRTINAVKTQLAMAVLVQLLLQLKRTIEHSTNTHWELLREIRTSLISKALAQSDIPDGCRWKRAPALHSGASCF